MGVDWTGFIFRPHNLGKLANLSFFFSQTIKKKKKKTKNNASANAQATFSANTGQPGPATATTTATATQVDTGSAQQRGYVSPRVEELPDDE